MSDDLIINPDVANPEKKIDLKKDLEHWRKLLEFMGANVPIQALCLPKTLEKALISDGIIRVYDLIGRDLTKIKGIGAGRLSLLTSRLDEFLSIGI